MRFRILILLVSLATAVQANSPDRLTEDISLDGEWQFWLPDNAVTQGLPQDVKARRTVVVPHTYNIIDVLEDYAGAACYERELPVSPSMRGKTLRVHFQGVYRDAVVSVNGQVAGTHANKGYTPFSIDISRYLDYRQSGKNVLRVECSNAYTEAALPYMRSFDWNNDGGIYRSVRLHVSGRHTLRYVHVTPRLQLADSTAVAAFAIRLFDEKTTSIDVRLAVTNRQTGQVVYAAKHRLEKKRQAKDFTLDVDMQRVQLWHFDHPNLYDFTCEVMDGSEVSDAVRDHFGIRQFRVEGRSFVLNGETVRLPGIGAMPGSGPLYGMAEPSAFMEQTVRAMKGTNATITRFHWVQDEQMLTLMDELGILAQEEVSWWQQPSAGLTPQLRTMAREAIEEMIEAHYNHPCIYGWGLSNEVPSNHDELRLLGEYARGLDSTRIIDAVSNVTDDAPYSNPSLVLDLPTWNEYTGTWHGNVRERLPEQLARLDSAMQDRPLFITEAGLCEPAFAGGDARRIDDMIYHIGQWQRWPFICGYIYFCLQDYRTQMGEEGRGKWRIRRHGVTTGDLTPKPSYQVLRQLASPIEILGVKAAGKDGNEQADGLTVTLRCKATIPSYSVRGYTIRYEDSTGTTRQMPLPDMRPGDTLTIRLPETAQRYAFDIMTPMGFCVCQY